MRLISRCSSRLGLRWPPQKLVDAKNVLPSASARTHHFKLLEVVRGAKSSPTTLATVMQMGRKIGKISVMAGNTDGFVANRSRAPFSCADQERPARRCIGE